MMGTTLAPFTCTICRWLCSRQGAWFIGVGILIVTALVVTAIADRVGKESPHFKGANITHWTLMYVLLLAGTGITLAHDWRTTGPTLAIKHGLACAAAAWVVAVPLGLLSKALLRSAWFILFLVAGFCAALAAAAGLEPPPLGLSVGAVVLFVSVWLAVKASELVTHALGTALLFLAVFWGLRAYLNAEPVRSWEGVELMSEEDPEYRRLFQEFQQGCGERERKLYQFTLQVLRIYRVRPALAKRGSLAAHNVPESSVALGPRYSHKKRLFHGTKRRVAKGILKDGFRKQERSSRMLSQGISFSYSPLKIWQYTDGAWGSWVPPCLRWPGLILCCRVELRDQDSGSGHKMIGGQSNRLLKDRGDVEQQTGVGGGDFWNWMRAPRTYDRIDGRDDNQQAGALKVPEIIVYDPKHVQVDFIFEVCANRIRPERGLGDTARSDAANSS